MRAILTDPVVWMSILVVIAIVAIVSMAFIYRDHRKFTDEFRDTDGDAYELEMAAEAAQPFPEPDQAASFPPAGQTSEPPTLVHEIVSDHFVERDVFPFEAETPAVTAAEAGPFPENEGSMLSVSLIPEGAVVDSAVIADAVVDTGAQPFPEAAPSLAFDAQPFPEPAQGVINVATMGAFGAQPFPEEVIVPVMRSFPNVVACGDMMREQSDRVGADMAKLQARCEALEQDFWQRAQTLSMVEELADERAARAAEVAEYEVMLVDAHDAILSCVRRAVRKARA